MNDLTPEEKALIIQALISSALKQPLWQDLVNSVFAKLGIEKEAEATFEHYKARAERRALGLKE